MSSISIPLGNCRFEGIDYRFAQDAAIVGEGILVLIPDDYPEAFAKRYPRTKVFGHYRKHLSNSGERLRLFDPAGNVLVSADYGNPWPRGTDGQGRALVPRDRRLRTQSPGQWKASATAGGTPRR